MKSLSKSLQATLALLLSALVVLVCCLQTCTNINVWVFVPTAPPPPSSCRFSKWKVTGSSRVPAVKSGSRVPVVKSGSRVPVVKSGSRESVKCQLHEHWQEEAKPSSTIATEVATLKESASSYHSSITHGASPMPKFRDVSIFLTQPSCM